MRIGIDARFLGPEGTGIGRYTEKLIENLEELDKENNYFIFLRRANYHLYNPKNPNFEKVTADAHWYSVKEQVIMPALLKQKKLDLVHFPQINIPLLYSGKFIVTLHDLTKINFKNEASTTKTKPVYLAKHFAFSFTLQQGLRKAVKIITPSDYVKKEIAKNFNVKKDKLVTTYEGADEFFDSKFEISEGRVNEVLGRFSIKNKYLLYVGNAYTYKNLRRLIETLPELDPEIKLVCVTKRDSFADAILHQAESLGVRSRVILTDWIDDQDLKILFTQAFALVFPSLSEGFGLPGLEAMALGCPVIAAKATSLPEIYEEAALYFDPHSSKDLAKKISDLLSDKKLRSDLIKKGERQVRKFSWRKMAELTLQIYQEAAKS